TGATEGTPGTGASTQTPGTAATQGTPGTAPTSGTGATEGTQGTTGTGATQGTTGTGVTQGTTGTGATEGTPGTGASTQTPGTIGTPVTLSTGIYESTSYGTFGSSTASVSVSSMVTLGSMKTTVTTAGNQTVTTGVPCYNSDVMYYNDAIVRIKVAETNVVIPVALMRADAAGYTSIDIEQPTFLVELNEFVVSQIVSISVPRKDGASNVNQIVVKFYGTNGEIIRNGTGQLWIVETIPGVTTIQQLVPQVPIGKLEIKVIGTTDGDLPKNISIIIIGCIPYERESSTTAASTKEVTSVSFTSTTTGPSVCVKVEAMKSQANIIEDIYTTPELAVNVNDFAPGQTGVSFPEIAVNPNITIVFNRPGNLFVVKVPEESETNVQQIAVSFFDEDDNLIVAYTSPLDSPVLPSTLDVSNVWKIVIEIMSTFNDESPKNVTLSVVGCFSEVTRPPSTTEVTGTTSACVLSQWQQWSTCSAECQYGRTRSRTRSVISGRCNQPLYDTDSCSNISCEECTITREKYRQQLDREPPSDDFVGYLINSTTLEVTNISIKIDDKIDRNASIFINNCTRLTCKPNGIIKEQVPCLEDCKYTPWSQWSRCNASCGKEGSRIHSRNLIPTHPYNPLCARQITETLPCIGDPCPCVKGVNCTCDVTQWCQWSSCSKSCGTGQQERTRQFRTSENENCTDTNLRETRPCNPQCCRIDGKFTEWSTWSTCSKPCDSGVQYRNRSCTNPTPSCNGKACTGNSYQTQVCHSHPCESNCTNGKIYDECANDCDRTCDSLTCDNQCRRPDTCVPGCICPPPKIMAPNGQCVERKECVCRLPTDNSTLVNGESNVRDPCTKYTCKDGCVVKQDKNCTVCEWSHWGPFTDCSNTCNGTQSRFRTFGGINCPDNRTEEYKRSCSSNCTIVCTYNAPNGSVITYKVGEIIQETACEKTVCRETGKIDTQPVNGANVDGKWSLWTSWTECSQTCKGIRKRYHLCISPEPKCAGKTCMALPDSEVDYVTTENNHTVRRETQYEKCNEICTTSPVPRTTVTPPVTTPHTECYVQNGSQVIVVPPKQVIINPVNPCEKCTCRNGKLDCFTTCAENEQTCLSKQDQDSNYRYTWIPPQPGHCCGICNKTRIESKCRLEILPAERVKVHNGKCISLTEVPRERCTGGCESGASNTLEMGNELYSFGNSTCMCCGP
ncbi:unnamed protein product, partial [Adineta ricciae]